MSLEQDDDDDFEFDFDSPRRKPIVRRGRRSEGSVSSAVSGSHIEGSPAKAYPPAKTMGWAEETQSTRMSWLRKMSRSAKGTPTKQVKTSRESSDIIPTIPDLSEVYEEQLASQVAPASDVSLNRVMTYQELDSDLVKSAAFQILDGVDLRLLTKHLEPENKIQEDDIAWTWDMLFADAASQQSEMWTQIELKSGFLSTDEGKGSNYSVT